MKYARDMDLSVRMRLAVVLLALSTSALVVHAAVASPRGASVSRRCMDRQQHLVAKGESPTGSPWTATASISNNGSCNAWLVGMEFVPFGAPAGRWKGAWGIPAGSHLPDRFTIGALDEGSGSERSFSGVAGARVRSIAVTTSTGEHFTIHPKLPPPKLRKRFVWLRNMRYFIRYYPVGQHVKIAKLLNSRGEVIYIARGAEGEFDGPF